MQHERSKARMDLARSSALAWTARGEVLKWTDAFLGTGTSDADTLVNASKNVGGVKESSDLLR